MTRHELWMSSITPAILARLGIDPPPAAGREDTTDGLLLDRVQRWDLEHFLAEGLLTKADRASMSSALELRAPFLDESVMAFAPACRSRNGCGILRRNSFSSVTPCVTCLKIHCSPPQTRIVRADGPLAARTAARLGDQGAGQRATGGHRGPHSAALELLAEHCQQRADHARALWSLIVLSEWLDWAAMATAVPGGLPGGLAACPERWPRQII